jgi:hypothetical protein
VILYRSTKSIRVTITAPDNRVFVIENMRHNDGPEITFDVTRDMTPSPSEASVSIFNLPSSMLTEIEAVQAAQVDDIDRLLSAPGLFPGAPVFADEAEPEQAGILRLRIEAGYDGKLGVVYDGSGARAVSQDDGRDTLLSITAVDDLQTRIYGRPATVFEAGAPTLGVVQALRSACGLGPGNLTPETWTALVGNSHIENAFNVSGSGFEALQKLLEHMPLRFWVDDGEIWFAARDGQGGAPAHLNEVVELDHPLMEKATKQDGGFVEFATLVSPGFVPGYVFPVTPNLVQESSSRGIRPGLYRVESVAHKMSTTASGGDETRIQGRIVK